MIRIQLNLDRFSNTYITFIKIIVKNYSILHSIERLLYYYKQNTMKTFFQFTIIAFLVNSTLSLTLDGSWIGIKYIITD